MIDTNHLVLLSITSSTILIIILLFYKFIYPKKNINLLLLTILISILPIISIFRPGTYQAGDLSLHSIFLQFFYDNLKDGILVPRWAGSDCAGYGCPIFLFQYIMPYYMGSVFHIAGFSYIVSMKLVLALTYIASGITMYIFLKDEFNDRAALTGSILYLFAPIRFIYLHYLVSVGMCVSCMFIPLAFLFAKKALKGSPIYLFLYSITFLFLILSHSSITFVTYPASILYAFIKKKKISDMVYPLAGALLGFGISSFYILPALFELKYDWLSFLGPIKDFKPFFQYIYSPVRYGLLFQGNNGEIRLIIGYTQILVVFYALYILLKNKFTKQEFPTAIFLLVFIIICFTLLQSFTKPIWTSIFFLNSFVEPWRLLIPISFFISFLGAMLANRIKKSYLFIFLIITILYTILNWGNRQMIPFKPDASYHEPSEYSEYVAPGNKFYIKRSLSRIAIAPELNEKRSKSPINILSGNGIAKEVARTQIYHEYIVYATSPILLSENTFYFPGWLVLENGKMATLDIQNNKSFGRLVFHLNKGLYLIEAKFVNTPIENIGNYITQFSYAVLSALLLFIFFRQYLIIHIRKKTTTK